MIENTLDEVLEGYMTEINYKSESSLTQGPGGALAKAVPKPKNIHEQADKNFVASLGQRELVLKGLYDDIRKTKNGAKLVKLVCDGQIKPDERNGLGNCPLQFAIDCEFPVEICDQLVKQGKCDPNSQDAEGDTCLHYAVNNENKAIEEWLVEEMKVDKDKKNKDGFGPYD